jgi:hypothetical protein
MVDRYLNMKLAGTSRSLVPFYQTTWHHIPEGLNLNPLTAKPCQRATYLKSQGYLGVNAVARKNPQHDLKLTSNDSKYRTCVKTYSFL